MPENMTFMELTEESVRVLAGTGPDGKAGLMLFFDQRRATVCENVEKIFNGLFRGRIQTEF
ncbi:MAG: hypothetical protein HC902_12895 [Calothrix sp. SM1_5_4]|nr:hypothetical protein [Calothrix sp. SM1_5_4]